MERGPRYAWPLPPKAILIPTYSLRDEKLDVSDVGLPTPESKHHDHGHNTSDEGFCRNDRPIVRSLGLRIAVENILLPVIVILSLAGLQS